MYEEQNGVIDVLAPYFDPLIDAANAHSFKAVNAVA
jgi:hypothetical protein